MKFTKEQKLILTLLTDIHKALNIKDSIDPDFVQKMVIEDEGWALEWKHSGIFESGDAAEDDTPSEVRFVGDVLDMWARLEYEYNALSADGKHELEQLADVFGKNVRFPGFDGNHESDLMGKADILINDLERWSTFAGRDLNSHMHCADGYERMLEVYDALPDDKYDRTLTVQELADILNERTHPSKR